MSRRDRLSGNEAVANAIRQIDPDVIAAFPITPSTEIPQYVSSFLAEGKLTTEFITVESEHSAISACVGAEAAGVRAMTATSSAGFAYMHEMLYVAASDRLPIVMAVVNRALTGPININCDHSDSMGSRDSGWMQLYSEDAQEAYDNMLMAHRIAEDPEVLLPIMVCQDGFITSHAVQNLVLEDDETAKQFVGEYHPKHYLLNPREPAGFGPYGISAYYMELKRQQTEAMNHAAAVIERVSREYGDLTGRYYGLIECYRMEDAEYAAVCIGSSAGTGKAAIETLRSRGVRAGLVKIRAFRPFPAQAIAQALQNVKAVAVMDKADSFSACGGPLGAEVRAALYQYGARVSAVNFVYGLGGRDVRVDDFYAIYRELQEVSDGKDYPMFQYIGVRE
ncbi:pyruvate ferredoxin oxidoreductase [Oscillibacter hominis]|uniref:Pyruvate ferredoxin oxidoreductase n=1 Tax=Oscillibacter hominis TaxID=2763056 RepID=A0A7G9B299_9FIRM|nr:pyruvate ferredoxin oxidoreductase [Oscillibacter hominis]QNL43680.1 pyruvate ferredoxin oxidoreductase [Oscillibacter hominis]